MFEFEEFKKEVVSTYRDMLSRKELDIKLENPTPGNLRDLSLKLFANGLSKEDTQVFQDFFNPSKRYDDLETSIRRFQLDKLKPLKNFITAKTNNPDEDIVKLLAILTQFTPRPFHRWRELRNSKNQDLETEIHELQISDRERKSDENRRQETPKEVIQWQEIILDNRIIENENPAYSKKNNQTTDYQFGNLPTSKLIKKEQYFPQKERTREKPPSKGATMNVQITFSNFRLQHLLYFFGLIWCMISVFAVIHFFTSKQNTCWIAIQYVATDDQSEDLYSKITTIDMENFNDFQTTKPTKNLAEAAVHAVRFSNIKNTTAYSPAPKPHPIVEIKPLKDQNNYIILLYSGERHQEKNSGPSP